VTELRYAFESDNFAPAHPQILNAVIACQSGPAAPYGRDGLSGQVDGVYSGLFERMVSVFPAWTGTAANGFALAAIGSPNGRILCHERAHILLSEKGAPSFFTGGAAMTPLAGPGGKIDPHALESALGAKAGDSADLVLSLSQSTESGTVYTPGELAALTGIAASAGVPTHMDGARFANAMVSLGATPAEMTWKSGIDILSLGVTKNGGMDCEAIVVFDTDIATRLADRLKTFGALLSKMRTASAQLLAYVQNDLWIHNAMAANAYAARLSAVLASSGKVTPVYPPQSNQLFVHIEPDLFDSLRLQGVVFRPWPIDGDGVYRLVTAYDETDAEIRRLSNALAIAL
jgi:threonine aldolase